MRPTTMRLVLITAVSGLFGAVPARALADITYNLVNDPVDQQGYTLSGTITTDGVIGPIGSNDIVAWTFTISGFGTSGTASSTDQGAFVVAGLSPTSTVATATSIMITDYLALDVGESAWLDWGPNPSNPFYQANDDANPGWDVIPTSSRFSGGTWTIATAASAVPEPGTLTLLGVGLAGCGGIGWLMLPKAKVSDEAHERKTVRSC